MTAKANGLNDEAQEILEANGITEDQLNLPEDGSALSPLKAVVPTYKSNWPLKATSLSFFEKALLGQIDDLTLEDKVVPEPTSNGFGFGSEDDEPEVKRGAANLMDVDEEEVDTAGWDMGDDIQIEEPSSESFVDVDSSDVAGAGTSSEAEMWARNSGIAADHVAAGSFETAMQLLNRQIGAVDFKPLKPRFMEIYQASKTYLPASEGLDPLVNYVRRTLDETDVRKVLPFIPRDVESVKTNDLAKGYRLMKENNLEEGVATFRRVLHSLIVSAAQNKDDVEDVSTISIRFWKYLT